MTCTDRARQVKTNRARREGGTKQQEKEERHTDEYVRMCMCVSSGQLSIAVGVDTLTICVKKRYGVEERDDCIGNYQVEQGDSKGSITPFLIFISRSFSLPVSIFFSSTFLFLLLAAFFLFSLPFFPPHAFPLTYLLTYILTSLNPHSHPSLSSPSRIHIPSHGSIRKTLHLWNRLRGHHSVCLSVIPILLSLFHFPHA